MRSFVQCLAVILTATSTSMAVAQPDTATTAEVIDVDDVEEGEVEVDFEEEVTFAEAIDRGDLDSAPMMPEYDERPWLLVLPVLSALVIAWNVRFKPGRRRHAKSRKKA